MGMIETGGRTHTYASARACMCLFSVLSFSVVLQFLLEAHNVAAARSKNPVTAVARKTPGSNSDDEYDGGFNWEGVTDAELPAGVRKPWTEILVIHRRGRV
jgi:hypothetical protein